MLETVDPAATHEETHEYLPEADHELKRVKVYELIGSRWVDQGTAFCFGQFQDETNEAFLIARAESNYNDIILSTAIRSNDVYQRQQDTLIVWTEPDGVDYALSFQDPEGCAEVWNFILEVQRHLNAGDDHIGIGLSSPSAGSEHSVTTASIIRSGHLPTPQLGIIAEVERAIKALARTQTVRDKICEYIQREEYVKALIDVMNQAEDLESIENLHALCSLMQTILLLNDHGIYEHILEDDMFFGVVGMLEYDPEFPAHKANYREFLHLTSRFHQPVPIHDEAIQKKVHHTYRLQFLKDVVLARALDDSTFNVLNSCIIFNQIDIINHVQQDPMFLREIIGLYVSEEVLGGNAKKEEDKQKTEEEKMDVDPKSATEPKANGVNGQSSRSNTFSFAPPDDLSDREIALRREVIILIQQLCVMGKNVQLPARMALFRTLVDRGILFAAQWALALPEKDESSRAMISAAGEIMAALLDHDLNGVRGHVLKQTAAIQREQEAGKKGADKAETILMLLCRMLARSRDLAIQSQVGDALKALLEISLSDGPEPPAGAGVKLLARGKDDPGTEKFLDYFYKNCIDILFKPFSDIPEFKNQSESVLKLSREKTNLYLYLCDLLCNFAQQHAFRSHFHMLSSNISVRVASLLNARDKHLRLAAFRFFRVCLKMNNRNFLNHLMKLDVFKPILELTIHESRRDSLLSASCQEFFEHIRRENIKDIIHHCMTKHEALVRKLAESQLGGPRFSSFIRRWEMNMEPPPKEEERADKTIETEEEDYFNADDDEDDVAPPFISSPRIRGQLSPSFGSLKRKRRGAMAASKVFRPQSLTLPRAPPLGSLLDYGEDDEDSGAADESGAAASNSTSPNDPIAPNNIPVSPSVEIPPSPRLSHRTIPPPRPSLRRSSSDEDENHPLESLVRPLKPGPPSPSLGSPKLPSKLSMPRLEKRRRDDDEDEMLERLASKAKRPDLGGQKDDSNGGRAGSAKSGDDPPKKIKVKFRPTSLGIASPSPCTPAPSETGAKDGDTG
ncbi:hypothetical protein SERLA73DRAFT_117880 [Serpula lacrymans var. lacrymans S7.3]|uniref:Uncharacterized protein n=1 Tax=Serpula lacrymans var. lacrymans (strain S7.3) TaxID=936435 RepID=F8QI31_SERL3|nr:hypothetical protein SERLA73DRAFT_117880 [Serpula lacrymans var. lacrymans S7.3]